ncbi:MAG: cyclophilin family peptidyl-prolyl cis-trans isomerase [Candidatus Pelagisphaera sp.]|jgi:cyclophilin family peptidyl-prolyl cis-trans isomerase
MKTLLFSFAASSALFLSSSLFAQTFQLEETQDFVDLDIQLGGAGVEIDLADYFTIDGVTGQVVQLDFDQGTINIEMLDAAAPLNVANFLSYVDDDSYNNTIIHRSIEGFVIQGGSFTATLPLVPVPTRDPVVNEFALSNLRGTLSMAKLADQPDSATSGFFISLADNSTILDPQNGGFTVFARVIGAGMDVADVIEDIPTWSLALDNSGFPFDDFPMLGGVNDDVEVDLMVELVEAKRVSMYPEVGNDNSIISFTVGSSSAGMLEATLSGSILTITPNDTFLGSATISVSAMDTDGNSFEKTFAAQIVSDVPGFSSRPMDRAVEIGRSVTVSATVVSDGEMTYQWGLDGSPIDGATQATFTIDSFSEADSGVYTLAATNSNGSASSLGGELIAISKSARLVNISTRGIARGGNESMIVGYFLSGGAGEKDMIVRGIGPGLGDRGVEGFMIDPFIRLVPGVGDEITNDDWGVGNDVEVLSEWSARSGASPLTEGSFDSVIAGSFPVAGYTAIISPKDGVSDGVVLAEAFDADVDRLNSDIRLFNISTRAEVGTGDSVLIAGFWVVGGEKANFLVRAIGPGLPEDQVSNRLVDPQLRVVDKDNNVVATSDDWGDSPFKDSLMRETLGVHAVISEEGSKDAATIVTLDEGGPYSIVVSGVGETTGVALVELFEIR